MIHMELQHRLRHNGLQKGQLSCCCCECAGAVLSITDVETIPAYKYRALFSAASSSFRHHSAVAASLLLLLLLLPQSCCVALDGIRVSVTVTIVGL